MSDIQNRILSTDQDVSLAAIEEAARVIHGLLNVSFRSLHDSSGLPKEFLVFERISGCYNTIISALVEFYRGTEPTSEANALSGILLAGVRSNISLKSLENLIQSGPNTYLSLAARVMYQVDKDKARALLLNRLYLEKSPQTVESFLVLLRDHDDPIPMELASHLERSFNTWGIQEALRRLNQLPTG